MRRIYLASSWRNKYHTEVYSSLINAGALVYNFKSSLAHEDGGPVPTAFSWAEIDANWQNWSQSQYISKLTHSPRAQQGFMGDFRGMEWADTCVLLMPCGRSAHIEAGYMKGRGKRLVIYYHKEEAEGFEPDLMYLLADHIVVGINGLISVLR